MIHDEFQTYLSIEEWKSQFSSLVAIFSTKNGGVSKQPFETLNTGLHVQDEGKDVIKNREILGQSCEAPLSNWVTAEQVHGCYIQKAGAADAGRGCYDYSSAVKQTDGLWTTNENLFLSLCYADCVPVYFVDPKSKFIGVVHAGWKGTVHNISGLMINEARSAGAELSDIQCYVGPSIGSCCYVVDDFVIDKIKGCLSADTHSSFQEISKGQYSLDLKTVNKQLLLNAGLNEDQIGVSLNCTSCDDEIFFSHRRDQGKTGRMSAVIGWKES